MNVEKIRVEDLSLDPANARKHPERNIEAIKASLRRFGQQKPIVIDVSNVVRAGNGTLEAAKALGWETLDCVRTELTGLEATAYAIADNRTAELAEWDTEMLKAQLQSIDFTDDELLEDLAFSKADLLELEKLAVQDGAEDQEQKYTGKIVSPVYQVTGKCPTVSDLYDTKKTQQLVADINAADVEESLRAFLLSAAERHTVFSFGRIAEFYAHQSAEVQRLMEDSALVIIDFESAIEKGFVTLNKEILGFTDKDNEGCDNE